MTELNNLKNTWAAYAVAFWSFVFAAMRFYWAAGGLVGAETLGDGIKVLALTRDSELLTMTWITGGLKVVAGLLALALVQSWGRVIPRRLRLIGSWGAAVLFLFYGIGNLIQHALIATGSVPIPKLLGSMTPVYWHLFFWDPFWIVGGVLYALAARPASYKPEFLAPNA